MELLTEILTVNVGLAHALRRAPSSRVRVAHEVAGGRAVDRAGVASLGGVADSVSAGLLEQGTSPSSHVRRARKVRRVRLVGGGDVACGDISEVAGPTSLRLPVRVLRSGGLRS